ncbi:hypothetical protein SPRG_04068 [Saprolegnia parasitica CBS 223.65]|uniref:PH domain-containing protein n=1 Tax=Saprolegnia parasitica (strain CBS 223.65) TaxID=695850 RepID=A0A067CLQ2_SAPPC|nr:hypothetical protein SPRG_04068 [Saprolegnia parasitica CBS 223.65]KDO31453.1 hypothetical protein SPRG_04068 [Saprolegnia parasitica CBS 223.65]|eukprot:XP_012198048.1 hypothetical protein SPRG_04068 [Saprolegnia parasitica CBS 223.65]
MIEGRLKALAEKLLGDWIESEKLDLSINIFNDENVRCENVNLKPSVVPASAPFRLKAGLIGALTMNIPFKTLGMTPAKLTLTDVLVILSPRTLDDVEKAKEVDDFKAEKRAALERDVLERIHGPPLDKTQIPNDAKKSSKDATNNEGYYGADGFFGRLVTRLMDNLQIELRNVHIRFEGDHQTSPLMTRSKFAIGFSIGALYAETTGANWRTGSFTGPDASTGDHVVFKLIQAINLSAYVDPHALHFVHSSTHPKVLHATLSRLKAMADMNARLDWWATAGDAHTHRFVLAPFHVTLKLTMNVALQTLASSVPRYDACFELSKLIVMVDDEQLQLMNAVLDSFGLHGKWRSAVAHGVKAKERERYKQADAAEYLVHWDALHKVHLKQTHWDSVKKSDAWKRLLLLEHRLPLEAILTLRNSATFGDDASVRYDADVSRSLLLDIGEMFGVPAPEINLKFARGALGLALEMTKQGAVVVTNCFAQAATKDALKPGMLLVKVDGRRLHDAFAFTSIPTLLAQLDGHVADHAVVLTFQHPEIAPAVTTPNQLVAAASIVATEVELRVVLVRLKRVIASAVVQKVAFGVEGFGPGLFSFHKYALSARHFYVQESTSDATTASCLVSSLDEMLRERGTQALRLSMNTLEVDHPGVDVDDVATYAVEYGCHVGHAVVVYEGHKCRAVLEALGEFSRSAFTAAASPSMELPPHSTTSTTMTNAVEPAPANVKYNLSFASLRLFVGVAKATMRRATSATATAYRSVFSQLTIHNAHAHAGLHEWLRDAFVYERVVAAVVQIQKYVRGRVVRRVALPTLRRQRLVTRVQRHRLPDALESNNLVLQGYFMYEDVRLGCRRWDELYVTLDATGVLRLFRDHTQTVYIDSFLLEHCSRVAMPINDVIGPAVDAKMRFLQLVFAVPCSVHNTLGVLSSAPPTSHTTTLLLAHPDGTVIKHWHATLTAAPSPPDVSSRQPRSDKIGLRQHIMGQHPMDVHKGWLFRQDLSLAFRRWHELFVYLDEYGVLRFYEDHTGRVLIDEERVEAIESVLHVGNMVQVEDWEVPPPPPPSTPSPGRPSNHIKHVNLDLLGPAGATPTRVSYCLEVTLKTESIADGKKVASTSTFLLASYSASDLADWRHSLFVKSQAVRSKMVDVSRRSLLPKVGWPTWLRSHLAFSFANTRTPSSTARSLYQRMAAWVSIFASDASLSVSLHDAPNLETSGALAMDFTLGKLEVRDRRSLKPYCVLYLGDTFLDVERGKLKPMAITSDHLGGSNGAVDLKLRFRSPEVGLPFGGAKHGLRVNLVLSGCLLPHDVATAMGDALSELSPLWASDAPPPTTVEPYLKATQLHLDVRVPMFEVYVEEKHCVAKCVVEKATLSFVATTDVESLDVVLGATSLYVMTKDNQLRLAQVDGFRVRYDLAARSRQRVSRVDIGQIKLEADGRMRILYQLFEALQHIDEDEDENGTGFYDDLDDLEDDEDLKYRNATLTSPPVFMSPPSSPHVVDLTPNGPTSMSRIKRSGRYESQHSTRSVRPRRSQRSIQSMTYVEGVPMMTFLGPLVSFQAYVALTQGPSYSVWTQIHDSVVLRVDAIVFEVVKRSLSRVALDTFIPVMKLSLSRIEIDASSGSEFKIDFSSTSSIVLLARYYNTALADWEPLVEPWTVAMDVAKTPRQELTVLLKARDRLNINFTEAFVRLLCSVQKHRKQTNPGKAANFLVPAVSEKHERVSVWNNLGVPIRLANLNTSTPGELTIEVRDGWSLPSYTRFHDVKLDAVLLPWWSPREASGQLESLSHTFRMAYGGANAGVAPKLRIKVSAKVQNAVQLQLDGTQAMLFRDERHDASPVASPRGHAQSSKADEWMPVGTVELNLAGSLMAETGAKRLKFCQWHRLRDVRGVITGEISVVTVTSGGSLTVDPFRLGSTSNTLLETADGDVKVAVQLPESIRHGYVPPLALEVLVDGGPRSLLCPLQRAGKFFIRGEDVVAEVKVAQRDEFRRVLVLSSPKQLKNLTNLTMNVGTFPIADCDAFEADSFLDPTLGRGRSVSIIRRDSMLAVPPGAKYSLPLSALYSEAEHCLVLQLLHSKRTRIADLSTLHKQVGCHILYLEPINPSLDCGYCFFMEIVSHVRNVYREQQYDVLPTETVVATADADEGDIMGHDAKYQVRLHAGFVFENALPIRLKYKVEVALVPGPPTIVCEGTLAPGEEVELHQFHKNAHLVLSLPEEASSWSTPLSLAKCISQEATHISNQTISAADLPTQRRPTEELVFYTHAPSTPALVADDTHLFTARLDFTVADNGSPRTVIYASVWLYNYSHVDELLVRCAEANAPATSCKQLLAPRPRLLDCPSLVLEMSTVFAHETAKWSEKLHASVVGVQRSITLKSASKKAPKREIGVSIQRPLGQFHRSTQVIISPRYVFVNETHIKFEVASTAKDPRATEVLPHAHEVAFDFPGDALLMGRKVRLKAGGAADANYLVSDKWSGFFSIDEEQEFSLWLPGARALWHDEPAQANVPRIRVKVHTVGASIVVTLSRDAPPMLRIANHSGNAFKAVQQGGAEAIVLPPHSTTTFAWELPDEPRKLAVSMLTDFIHGEWRHATQLRLCDFDSLDREEAVVWADRRAQTHIAAEVKFQDSSRVLVLRSIDSADVARTKFCLEVSILAVRRSLLPDEKPLQAYIRVVADTASTTATTFGPQTIKSHGVYRFESKETLLCAKRPRELRVELYEDQDEALTEESDVMPSLHVDVGDASVPMTPPELQSPTHPFMKMHDHEASSHALREKLLGRHTSASQLSRRLLEQHDRSPAGGFDFGRAPDAASSLSVGMPVVPVDGGDEDKFVPDQCVGGVDIKLPKKVWQHFQHGTERSLSDLQGYWWNLTTDDGRVIGQAQVALKFTLLSTRDDVKTRKPNAHDVGEVDTPGLSLNVRLSSVAVSFIHNTNRLDVAYLSLQRLHAVYSAHGGSSELAIAVGNLQMDNQMDRKVVLGPRGVKRKEGVSVRLRDRWKSCLNHQYRGIYEQVDVQALPVIQFRMLYNDVCSAGAFHVELVELIVQELEITTDEKFVVNLISVFQGVESLGSAESFATVVDTRVRYRLEDASAPITDGIYIEQLDIESIRILFSLELNGGKHIATLGPSGRRLAMYLPVSNVKDMRLNFSKLLFVHIYESKRIVLEKLYRHYHQQALYIVLQGLYTVSLFVNPFRIVYRLGHGFLEVVRLPTRGLASGSPVELISGAYLGVRSLAMNTISASYETVAGATGVVAAVIAPLIVSEDKKTKFKEEMVNFQRAVMGEVEAFDAAEERHMSKLILREPRVFTGIGLLVEYGPGARPKEDQMRVDLQAAVLVQKWWRRRRLSLALLQHVAKLRAANESPVEPPPRSECVIL